MHRAWACASASIASASGSTASCSIICLVIACACDLRIAARGARFGFVFPKVGLSGADMGVTYLLPRIVGLGHASELLFFGDIIDAAHAERIGLVNRLVDGDPVQAGIAYAREFSGHSLPVLGLAREAVMRALDTPVSEGLKIEADLSTLAFRTEDATEGMSAFIEKRKPSFKDR